MSTYIFLGPSLPIERARELLDATYLPPIQQGDILHLLERRPVVLGIIDGYFEIVPAVWHKEILIAMAEGVHVFGAASMGALRAAELHMFGMIGIGRVFEWYRDGVLTADDEVAVVHGPPDTGYRVLCDAMVDIRDACMAAVTDSILPAEVADWLVAIGKKIPYQDRSYRAVAQRAQTEGIDRTLVEHWLMYVARRGPGCKQRDAEALLRTIHDFLAISPRPKQVSYRVESTVFLEQLRNEVALAQVTLLGRPPAHEHEPLRAGETLATLRKKQLLRIIARQEAERLGWKLTVEEIQEYADRFRTQNGLTAQETMLAWMEAEGVTEAAFWQYINDACLIDRLERLHGQEIDTGLADQLRIATAHANPATSISRGLGFGARIPSGT
jgi:hypothetical protein